MNDLIFGFLFSLFFARLFFLFRLVVGSFVVYSVSFGVNGWNVFNWIFKILQKPNGNSVSRAEQQQLKNSWRRQRRKNIKTTVEDKRLYDVHQKEINQCHWRQIVALVIAAAATAVYCSSLVVALMQCTNWNDTKQKYERATAIERSPEWVRPKVNEWTVARE